jgi:hypothetical protein
MMEARDAEVYNPIAFDGHQYIRVCKGYKAKLSLDNQILSIQRGKAHGRMVITDKLSKGDWLRTRDGLVATLGVTKLPYPGSPGRVAGYLLSKYARGYNVRTPLEVNKLAWQSGKGGRMESIKLGTYQAYGDDISSAYPSVARDLPWAECNWIHSTKFHGDAFYGFATIIADIPDMIAGPIAVRVADSDNPYADDATVCYPVDCQVKCTVSMPELRLLNDMSIPYKIVKGVWGYPMYEYFPFRNLMNSLYEGRKYDKDGFKALSVAVVGQMCSVVNMDTYYEARRYYSPVYISHIYAETRCKVYRRALQVGLENVAGFTIDGLVTMVKPIPEKPGFGNWRLENDLGEFFGATCVLHDRPGGDYQWRESVMTTPEEVQQGKFNVTIHEKVSLASALGDRNLREYLGKDQVKILEFPLGSSHRALPAGVTRQDFLNGVVDTHANKLGQHGEPSKKGR